MKKQLQPLLIAIIFWVKGLAISISATALEIPDCKSIDEKPFKIEAWISKKFKKERKAIKKEIESLGQTKVILRVFPMKEPAHVVGIGKCVPSYIGQHALRIAVKYAGGVEMLVDQNLLSHNWVGIGTMNFDEYSQRTITEKELKQLLNGSLDTPSFQKLVAQYSTPKKTFKAFGLEVPNVRRSNIKPPLRN